MNFRIIAASAVFLLFAACGGKASSGQLCGTNQQILSNVATTCTGTVYGSSSGTNNGASNSSSSSASTNSNSGNSGNNGSNNSAVNNGGQAVGNFANLFANGSYNPFDVSANTSGWNGSDAQAAVDAFLASGGEVPAEYHIPIVAAGAGPGGGPRVQIRVADTQQVVFDQFVYAQSFVGGVRVAMCDVNGDGTADLVTVPGSGGGPNVRVFDGRTGSLIGSFFAFDQSLRTGNFVACADVDGDGKADIIVTADVGGGPAMAIFSGTDPNGSVVLFNGFVPGFDPPTDRAGLSVGIGDVDRALDANGKLGPEILVAHASYDSDFAVVKWVGVSQPLQVVYPRASANMGNDGLHIAGGDVDGDGHADIILGRNGTASTVQILSGANPNQILASTNVYDGFNAGIYVAAGFLQRTANANFITGAGPSGGPHVKAFIWQGLGILFSQLFFDDATAQTFRGGVSVAAGLAF